jgi:hypothetical protein
MSAPGQLLLGACAVKSPSVDEDATERSIAAISWHLLLQLFLMSGAR